MKNISRGPEFRVSKNTEVNNLASAIFTNMKNLEQLELKCIGAASMNQAMKAIATARGMSASIGFDLMCRPYFDEVVIQGEEKTAINIIIEKI